MKTKPVIGEEKCWRNIYSTKRKRRNIKRIITSIIKMEHLKYHIYSSVSKFVTKNGSKQMIYQVGNVLLIKYKV